MRIAALLLLVVACAPMPRQTPDAPYRREGDIVFRSVLIESQPPGANIIVNDAFMGQAPLRCDLGCEWAWGTSRFQRSTYFIEAQPTREMVDAGTASGVVATREVTFHRPTGIPARILMNLEFAPLRKGIDIDVDLD